MSTRSRHSRPDRQRRIAFGAGHYYQDAQRQVDGERVHLVGALEEPGERCVHRQRQELVAGGVIQVFPGQGTQFGRIAQPQPQVQRLAFGVGAAPAFLPQRQQRPMKERVKEPPPYLARQ